MMPNNAFSIRPSRPAGRFGGATSPALCAVLGGAAWAFGLYRLLIDPGPARLAEQVRFLQDWMLLFSDVLASLGAGLLGAAACLVGTVLLIHGARGGRAVRRAPSPGVHARVSTASS
jgi:ABC-type nitrate/sulfonate/bicarbonate transport system permease component